MLFIIQSENERGFWSNKQGWVFGVEQATKFTAAEVERTGPTPTVISKGNDARWQVYKYD